MSLIGPDWGKNNVQFKPRVTLKYSLDYTHWGVWHLEIYLHILYFNVLRLFVKGIGLKYTCGAWHICPPLRITAISQLRLSTLLQTQENVLTKKKGTTEALLKTYHFGVKHLKILVKSSCLCWLNVSRFHNIKLQHGERVIDCNDVILFCKCGSQYAVYLYVYLELCLKNEVMNFPSSTLTAEVKLGQTCYL